MRNLSVLMAFERRSWLRRLFNFSLFRSKGATGQIISMHQSGTHWLKFMLANAISEHFSVPSPKYNHANDIIGGPKDTIMYPQIPRLLASHTIPSPFFYSILSRPFNLPKYVLLIRDLRLSLISNYRKWRHTYRVNFSAYLEGDPAGKKYNSDIWWAFRFLNCWGCYVKKQPTKILVVRYEDLVRRPTLELERINQFWLLGLPKNALRKATEFASKEAMAIRNDPTRPSGAVQMSSKEYSSLFSVEDKARFRRLCADHLSHSFGYDYETGWEDLVATRDE